MCPAERQHGLAPVHRVPADLDAERQLSEIEVAEGERVEELPVRSGEVPLRVVAQTDGGLPIAIAGHGYTGFFLALSKARAFWNTALNPALFMVSAMVSGLAVLIVLSNLWLRRYAACVARGAGKMVEEFLQILRLTWSHFKDHREGR